MKHKHSGFLIITAAFLIIILGLIASTMVKFNLHTALNASEKTTANQVQYASEAGIEQAAYKLRTQSCNNFKITDHIDSNQITVKSQGNIYLASSKLEAIYNNGIKLRDTSGFSPQGRVLINGEAIDYYKINPPFLSQIRRGSDNTKIKKHILGEEVNQLQCNLESIAEQKQTQHITLASMQLAMAWAVGDNSTTLQWNYPEELNWQQINNSAKNTLYDICMLNYNDGWTVGQDQTKHGIILHKNKKIKTPPNIPPLYSVTAISSNEAWAVGKNNNGQFNILHWDGKKWQAVKTKPSKRNNTPTDLYGIDILDKIGFAVGQANASPTILQYSNGNWREYKLPTNLQTKIGSLQHVVMANQHEAWAIGTSKNGKQGVILNWQYNNWHLVLTTPSNLHSIHTHNSYTIAVGEEGLTYHYDGNKWLTISMPNHKTYYDIKVNSSNNAWAVGEQGSRAHWNGKQWIINAIGGPTLHAIAYLGPNQNPISAWHNP